jgi:formylglycine-generating enzyme required for sulfatase activity
MVAAAPEDRFSSMADAAAALQSALDDPPAVRGGTRLRRRLALAALPCAALGALIAWQSGVLDFSESKHDSPAGPPPPLAVAPFAAEQAAEHQRQWARYMRKPVRVENSIGMPLVLIPPGEFQMGVADEASFEPMPPVGDWRFREPEALLREHQPQHRVVLTKPIYLGATEVTHGQFREFVDATGYVTDAERNGGWGREDKGWVKRPGYSWKNMGQRVSEDRHPVINVTWNDAAAMCAWLTSEDDLGVYRLPTEAEWEFACRAGSTTMFSFGDDAADLREHGWFTVNSEGRFRPAGLKQANPFGLYDMYGNRQEWCQDAYAADFYASSPLRDPVCETGGERVMRGGAHTDLASICASARRWNQAADDPGAAGIRVACELRAVP